MALEGKRDKGRIGREGMLKMFSIKIQISQAVKSTFKMSIQFISHSKITLWFTELWWLWNLYSGGKKVDLEPNDKGNKLTVSPDTVMV